MKYSPAALVQVDDRVLHPHTSRWVTVTAVALDKDKREVAVRFEPKDGDVDVFRYEATAQLVFDDELNDGQSWNVDPSNHREEPHTT